MTKPFNNRDLFQILEAYSKMNESLTIPINANDELEKQLYSKLDKNYKYADFIVRWYRNDKKAGKSENELNSTYIYNLNNIIDLLKDYDKYISELQRSRILKEFILLPTENGGTWKMNPVSDFPSIRRLDGVRKLVDYLGNLLYNDKSSIRTSNSKYAISDSDRSNIRIVGFSNNVVVWATRTFDSTNKFVYQLWQNAETMERGDAYGNKMKQSPYCTHAISHWETYSQGYNDYQQFWFLSKIYDKKTNVQMNYVVGDLTNPSVVNIFNNMAGTGPYTIIAMNDTGDDFLDSDDSDFDEFDELGLYGNQVKKLDSTLFYRTGTMSLVYNNGEMEVDDGYENDVEVRLRSDGGDKNADIKIDNVTILDKSIKEIPNGIPENITGDFDCSGCRLLKNIDKMPKEVGGVVKFYRCSSLGYDELSKHIDVKQRAYDILTKNIYYAGLKKISMNENTISFIITINALDTVYDNCGDCIDFDTLKAMIEQFEDEYDITPDKIEWENVDSSIFDNMLSEFKLNFEDIVDIYNDNGYELVNSGKMDKYHLKKISKLIDDDFYNGCSMSATYISCLNSGTYHNLCNDILKSFETVLPIDDEYGLVYDKEYAGYTVKIVLDNYHMCELVKNYDDAQHFKIIEDISEIDKYGDIEKISIRIPYDGWVELDDEMWKKAISSFSEKVYKIMDTSSPVKDLEGQQYFDFDKDYLDNPENYPRN